MPDDDAAPVIPGTHTHHAGTSAVAWASSSPGTATVAAAPPAAVLGGTATGFGHGRTR